MHPRDHGGELLRFRLRVAPALIAMRKKYKASTIKIVKAALKLAKRLKREGWTRQDHIKALLYPPLEGETATEHLNRVRELP